MRDFYAFWNKRYFKLAECFYPEEKLWHYGGLSSDLFQVGATLKWMLQCWGNKEQKTGSFINHSADSEEVPSTHPRVASEAA